MIGLICKNSEQEQAHEFFELFKTPWERFVAGRRYDVVITTCDEPLDHVDASLLLIFSSILTKFDEKNGITGLSKGSNSWLEWNGISIPVYGDLLTFEPAEKTFVQVKNGLGAVGIQVDGASCQIMRIGYDLFREVLFLLSKGQPPANASIPTLELHIAMLRNCMLTAGISFVEIPPVPAGYDFMACLTHDVDFTGIRLHKFDHTMWGFVYRALVGSADRGFHGKLSWRNVYQNWKAVLSLPLVYLGLLPDFWMEFERYCEIEKNLGSTYFFLPYKDRPGGPLDGPVPARRAAKYDINDVKDEVRALLQQDCEVGLHGIDAWHSAELANQEMNRIREVTGHSETGVRMHWLFFEEKSPKALEDGGLSYDSTFGYNDAVGFRAGTPQPFCPPGARVLLELPLNVQDTALFYPGRMNLSERDALTACKNLLHSIATRGGVLTVNWHTRSLSPERLWGAFYSQLLKEVQVYRVWFATAAKIVKWFRNRRALTFQSVEFCDRRVCVKLSGEALNHQPAFLLRVHQPRPSSPMRANSNIDIKSRRYFDTPWNGHSQLDILVPEFS